MNESRAVVGLPAIERLHGGISEQLALVATFPQLEYPRSWPAAVQVTGPIEFELPYPDVELPDGRRPAGAGRAVDRAGSRLPAGARGARGARRRAGAGAGDDEPPAAERAAAGGARNAAVVDWLSYSQAMAAADLVICHGGHGTVARALGAGAPVLCCPAVGDMAENGARVAWAGAGLMLPWRSDDAGDAAADGATAARRGLVRRREPARSRPGRATTTAPQRARRAGRGAGSGLARKGPLSRAFEAPGVGLEPTTLRLTAACSAIELPRTVIQFALPSGARPTQALLSTGYASPTSTSAWQFAHSSTHFAASARSSRNGPRQSAQSTVANAFSCGRGDGTEARA